MKNLLSTTALIAGIAFSGAAFAQDADLPNADLPNPGQVYTWEVQIKNPAYSETDATQGPLWYTTTATGTYEEYATAFEQANESAFDAVQILEDTLALAEAPSLLDSLLVRSTEIANSLSNISENLADLDATIKIDLNRDWAGVSSLTGIDKEGEEAISTSFVGLPGSFSQAGDAVAYDVDTSFLAPLTANLGELSTTLIGALNTGTTEVMVDLNTMTKRSEGIAGDAGSLVEEYSSLAESLGGGLNVTNYAYNTGGLIGGIDIAMSEVNATVGNTSTTVIGALGTGDIVASLIGNRANAGAVADTGTAAE